MLLFPTIQASNLQGKRYHLPADFEGDLNIILISFWSHQQYDIATWHPCLKRLQAGQPRLRYYELLAVRQQSRLRQFWQDISRRLGVPDRHTRETTIPLYVDKGAFRRDLDIPHEDAITVALVTRRGDVLWRAMGPYNSAKGAALSALLQSLSRTTLPGMRRQGS